MLALKYHSRLHGLLVKSSAIFPSCHSISNIIRSFSRADPHFVGTGSDQQMRPAHTVCCMTAAVLLLCLLQPSLADEFNVYFSTDKPLGLKLSADLTVQGFHRDPSSGKRMPAEESGWIKQGDVLLEINEETVAGKPLAAVQQMVQRASVPKIFRFRATGGENRTAEVKAKQELHGGEAAAAAVAAGGEDGVLEISRLGGAPIARIPFTQAAFGGPIRCQKGPLKLLRPLTGCMSLRDTPGVMNSLVLADRGTCTFSDKAVLAQGASALALIMINFPGEDNIRMQKDPQERSDISLPVLMVKSEAMQKLLEQLGAADGGGGEEQDSSRGRRKGESSSSSGSPALSGLQGKIFLAKHSSICAYKEPLKAPSPSPAQGKRGEGRGAKEGWSSFHYGLTEMKSGVLQASQLSLQMLVKRVQAALAAARGSVEADAAAETDAESRLRESAGNNPKVVGAAAAAAAKLLEAEILGVDGDLHHPRVQLSGREAALKKKQAAKAAASARVQAEQQLQRALGEREQQQQQQAEAGEDGTGKGDSAAKDDAGPSVWSAEFLAAQPAFYSSVVRHLDSGQRAEGQARQQQQISLVHAPLHFNSKEPYLVLPAIPGQACEPLDLPAMLREVFSYAAEAKAKEEDGVGHEEEEEQEEEEGGQDADIETADSATAASEGSHDNEQAEKQEKQEQEEEGQVGTSSAGASTSAAPSISSQNTIDWSLLTPSNLAAAGLRFAVVAQRGGCSFHSKYLQASTAGAAMLLVSNKPPEHGQGSMGAGEAGVLGGLMRMDAGPSERGELDPPSSSSLSSSAAAAVSSSPAANSMSAVYASRLQKQLDEQREQQRRELQVKAQTAGSPSSSASSSSSSLDASAELNLAAMVTGMDGEELLSRGYAAGRQGAVLQLRLQPDEGAVAELWDGLEALQDSTKWPAESRQRRKHFLQNSKLHHPDKPTGSQPRFERLSTLFQQANSYWEARAAAGEQEGHRAKDEL